MKLKDNSLNKTLELLDDVVEELEIVKLDERMNVSKYNSVSITTEGESIKDLFKDLKKSLVASNMFYSQVASNPNYVVTEKYLKYYRLLSKNGKIVSKEAAQKATKTYWEKKIPHSILEKCRNAIDSFIQEINKIILKINSRIRNKIEKIDLVDNIPWKISKQKWDESKEITMNRLFEKVYREGKYDEVVKTLESNMFNDAVYTLLKQGFSRSYIVTVASREGIMDEHRAEHRVKKIQDNLEKESSL
jgi:hypothetical protein